MENLIAISQTISAILIIVTAITGVVTFTTKTGKAWIQKHIFEPIQKPIHEKIELLDISMCKDYLTEFINDMENDDLKSEVQIQRAYEIYDHYINDLHQNSYIHSGFERLKEKGLI